MRKIALATIFSVTASGPALSDDIPPCAPPSKTVAYSELAKLPASINHDLKRKFGPIAPVGAGFDATDVIMVHINHRLIRIWKFDNRWIVAVEEGGIAYHDPILLYETREDGGTTLLIETAAIPNTVCATMWKLVAGRD